MKIIAVMRAYNYDDPPLAGLEPILPLVDGVIFRLDPHITKPVMDAVDNCEKTLHVFFGSLPFRQRRSLNDLFQAARQYEPDVVIYADEDEILPGPNYLRPLIDNWWERTAHDTPTIMFEYLMTWNGADNIVDPRLYRTQSHGKVVVYEPKLVDFHHYRARCLSCEQWRREKLICPWPLRHLQFNTARLRALRHEAQKARTFKPTWTRNWHEMKNPPTVKFNPEWCKQEYVTYFESKEEP